MDGQLLRKEAVVKMHDLQKFVGIFLICNNSEVFV